MGLEDLKKKIEKNVKGANVDVLSKSKIASINEWVPTPHYDLNRVLSGSLFKGIPEKTLTLLVGPEASFKSSFMCLSMMNAQKMGYTPVILDTEGAWTNDFVQNWGLDPDKILYAYTPFVDEATSVLGQLLNEGEKFIIGIDSIGNLENEKLQDDLTKVKRNDDGSTETKSGDTRAKADQGQLQKKIKRMLKVLLAICKKQNSIGLIAGHYYGSPSMYGAAEEIGGGYHMRLAPHIIISLKKSKIIEKKKVIGNQITAITMKNRFYPAFQTCNIEIDYTQGLNKYTGLEEIAIENGMIEQGGSWFTNTTTGEKIQGKANLGEWFKDESVLKKLDEYVQKTGYSTIDKEMEEAESAITEQMEELSDEEVKETKKSTSKTTAKTKKYSKK